MISDTNCMMWRVGPIFDDVEEHCVYMGTWGPHYYGHHHDLISNDDIDAGDDSDDVNDDDSGYDAVQITKG